MGRPAKARLPIDLSDLGLSQKELVFIGEYCTNGFNDFEAMKTSGLVPKTATLAQSRMQGIALTNKPAVKAAMQRFTDNVLAPYRDKLEYQDLQLLQARAYYDMSTYYNKDGSVKDLEEISPQARLAIDDITEDFKGKDADVRTVKYKLADRMQARKELGLLLKKSEAQETDEAMPQDRRARLDELFQAAGAGAMGAMGAMAFMDKYKKAEKNATPKSSPDVLDVVPEEKTPPSTSKLKEAMERRAKRLANGQS